MEFTSLASSSAGNAYIVSDGSTNIMLECGLRYRELERRVDHRLSDIAACLITHEHTDHSHAHNELTSRGFPVYASTGTAAALNNPLIRRIRAKEPVQIGTFKVLPFGVFHDAAEPLGFLIRGGDGEQLLFATDTASIPCAADGLHLLAVECNHDRKLIAGLQPWQKRAALSHMSIDALCEYIDRLDRTRLRRIYLLHLSDRHSDEAAFVQRVQSRYHIDTMACAK